MNSITRNTNRKEKLCTEIKLYFLVCFFSLCFIMNFGRVERRSKSIWYFFVSISQHISANKSFNFHCLRLKFQPTQTYRTWIWEVMLLNSIHFLCPMQSVGQWKVSCNRCNRISSDWRSLDLRPSTVLDSRRLGRIEAFRPIARASCFIFRCFSFPWPTQSMNWGSIQPHTHKQVVLELLFPKPKDRKPIPARLNWRQQFQDSGYSQF